MSGPDRRSAFVHGSPETVMPRWATVVLASCIAWALAIPGALAAVLAVGPYTPTATAPLVVPITVTGAVNLDAFTFDLGFDPTAFAIATSCDPFGDPYCDFVTGPVTPGNFYAASAFPALFEPGFILLDANGTQTGRLLAVTGAWQDPGPAPSGDGILAYVEFVALPGASLDAPIVVTGPALPFAVAEPETCALTAAAVAALVATTRRRRTASAGRPALAAA